MTNEEYVKNVKRTESPNFNLINERILHGAIGICTESGEIMDAVKKSLFYGRKLDEVNLVEELGDLFWYIGIVSDALGISFEEIMERNINKLRVRYPKQFEPEKEQNRDLDSEREVLEK
jgi:NTP pyrophosphatase (non-canonical NTP hydrolase)